MEGEDKDGNRAVKDILGQGTVPKRIQTWKGGSLSTAEGQTSPKQEWLQPAGWRSLIWLNQATATDRKPWRLFHFQVTSIRGMMEKCWDSLSTSLEWAIIHHEKHDPTAIAPPNADIMFFFFTQVPEQLGALTESGAVRCLYVSPHSPLAFYRS